MIINVLFLILPRIMIGELGHDAPFGLVISTCPMFIVAFLFLTAPLTLSLNTYTQITVGAFFTTFAPLALLFGFSYTHLFMTIILLSLGEALASPKIYEMTFDFTVPGREGMFLALSAAPWALTMGVSGYASGWLMA